jgi:hypothetical protein
MSDQISLAIGATPWGPSVDAHIEQEYDRYNMPTAGVLSQSGCLFLFECFEGAAQQFNFWAYAPILAWEAESLNLLSGAKLLEAMNKIWHSRDATVALAVDDRILTGTVISEMKINKLGLSSAALQTIRDLLEREIAVTEALSKIAR